MAAPKPKQDVPDDHDERISELEAHVRMLIAESNKVCKTCVGWKPLQSDMTLGHCIPSAKAMPAPMITMDKWSCSKWAGSK